MSSQPNNDTLYAQNLAEGSLAGPPEGWRQKKKKNRQGKRTLRSPLLAPAKNACLNDAVDDDKDAGLHKEK
jgi:hypothetical protein